MEIAEKGFDDLSKKGEHLPRKFAHCGGGSGLVGTGGDYMNFCLMLQQGGVLFGNRLLSAKTVQWMTDNHLRHPETGFPCDMSEMLPAQGGYTEVAAAGAGFGLGFSCTTDPMKGGVMSSKGNFGWGGAASTQFWIDKSEELCVVFMTQLRFRNDKKIFIRKQLPALVYGCLVAASSSTAVPSTQNIKSFL